MEHWQGRVETLTTSIYLGEIRDRFFFLFTKISEYYLDSNSASRKLIKLSNHGTDCFHNLLIEAESMSDVHNCGTARPRYTYQEPLKLQNVDKVTEEDRALMDVARDMWTGVIKKGL